MLNTWILTADYRPLIAHQQDWDGAGGGYWLLQGFVGKDFAAHLQLFKGQVPGEDGKLGSNSSIVKENPASTMYNGIYFIGGYLKISR